MNKSKLKFFIGSILSLNCFFIIEKVDAAMRRPSSSSQSSQPSTSRSTSRSYSTVSSTFQKQSMMSKTKSSTGGGLQNLSQEEIKPIIESAKKLINDGNFSMSDILERSFKFIRKGTEDIKSSFDVLNEKHYIKSFEDYKRKDKRVQYNETVYFFEKNDSDDQRQVYVKFSLNRENKDLRLKFFSDNAIEVEGVDSSKDISKILNNPEYAKNDFSGRVVDKAISILESKIDSRKYRILNRARYGLEQLGYTQNDFKRVMKSLTKKNYISGPDSVRTDKDNIWNIQQGDLFIFGYKDPQTDKEIYIKFVIEEGSNNILILSFHETDNDLRYFFKELQ